MAIQFKCPQCEAQIKVPDTAAGQVGRCPACELRIAVPNIAPPSPGESTEPIAAQHPDVAPPAPAENDAPARDDVPDFSGITGDEVVDDTTIPQIAVDAAENSAGGEFPISDMAVGRSRSVARRLEDRQRTKRGSVLIPLSCCAMFLVVLAAAGIRLGYFRGPLEGELTGSVASDVAVDPHLMPRKEIKAPKETLDLVLTGLEENSESLLSRLMRLEFSGSSDGLTVSLVAERRGDFYVVAISQNESLQEYRDEHDRAWNALRLAELEKATTRFVTEYAQAESENRPVESLAAYRDSIGVNALVEGLGYVLAAKVETSLDGRKGVAESRCMAEQDGNLYFLLPRGTKSFQIVGRDLPGGHPKFPGSFTVNVKTAQTP